MVLTTTGVRPQDQDPRAAWNEQGTPGSASPTMATSTTRRLRPGSSTTCRHPAAPIHQVPLNRKALAAPSGNLETLTTRLSAGLPCLLPAPPEKGTRHGYIFIRRWSISTRLGKTRDQVLNEPPRRKIGHGRALPALHLQPTTAKVLGHNPGDFRNAEFISRQQPSQYRFSSKLTDEDAST